MVINITRLAAILKEQDDDKGMFDAWTEQDRAQIAELEKLSGGVEAFGLNAYVSLEGSCNSFGQNAVLVNVLVNSPVTATVRIHETAGLSDTTYDRVETVPAGSRKNIGCTYYQASPYPIRRSYMVVGTVP